MAFLEIPYRLEITDGTVKVDLARPPLGIREYRPNVAAYKDNGIFQQSPLSNGRRLVNTQFDNITDNISLSVTTRTADGNIYELQQLMRLFEKAAAYWTSRSQKSPVYVIRQARRETNIQYAVISVGRIPQIEFPFGQPFIMPFGGSLSNVNAIIEHGHWQSTVPGQEGDCVLATNGIPTIPTLGDYEAKIESYTPFGLWPLTETSGTTATNTIDAALNGTYPVGGVIFDDIKFLDGSPSTFISSGTGYVDVYTAGLNTAFDGDEGTALLWFRTTGGLVWQSGNQHYFWNFQVDASNYIRLRKITTDYAMRLERAGSGTTQTAYYVSDGTTEWLCFVATWKVGDYLRLYVNGEQIYRTPITAGSLFTGNLSSTDSVVGCDDNTGAANNLAGDANYFALWNRQLTADDVSDISNIFSLEPSSTCNPVYFGNQQLQQSITHIYTYDDSGASYSVNRAGDDSFDIFPATPAANDYILFGILDGANAMPFSSLVLYIGTIASGITMAWQYWNGAAWTALTVEDNTNGLTESGENSVHWVNPSAWATRAENSVTLYWIRAFISAVSSPVNPTQSTQAVYTAISNAIEVSSEAVGGDITALLAYQFRNVADSLGGGSANPQLWSNRFICGLRSYDRGESFNSITNLSDRGNPSGLSLSTFSADTAYATDVTTPSGRRITWTRGSSVTDSAMFRVVYGTIAASYQGKFHVYVIGKQHTGSTGQFGLRLRFFINTSLLIADSGIIYSASTEDWNIFDMGEVDIASDILVNDEIFYNLRIQFYGTATAALTAYLYELVFIPVDEWSADIVDIEDSSTSRIDGTEGGDNNMLRVDSIRIPKNNIRAVRMSQDGSRVFLPYQVTTNGQAILQANTRQRLWVLIGRDAASGGGTDISQWRYEPYLTHTAQLFKSQRYLGNRGFR